ncbi:CRISPR-associated protein Cas1 [Bifidobacterium sp. UTCIF-37]|uniref:CRISPR-associated endonuclease Cas1 n=1 Tax=Bifidobacterium callitrichos DSM 23973 TaxID=1437609 RepID=A0A087A6R3_9BIFI|nr:MULTISPECIES: type II CRISPR-associated endonuclease Cas1 [Bifidobacterium]KFI54463.1 CRISPR-associated protein Cas1 [Bifidobacterium callitrichos DSM 23973]TPF86949.1 CRISPR-associated protein Cas1 [Bifidobacterium sp. UTCIF-37]TPF90820.1 CRISPR-associated protein Cas1 [Bifidobacterium sp. UTCIF-38]
MQSQWRVVDCTEMSGNISYVRGCMRVQRDAVDEPVDVPLSQVAVVLLGLRISCSASVLHEMARYGVSVLLCDWRGVPDAALHAWTNLPTTVTRRQLAQVDMTLPRGKNAWGRIVQAKIRGQAACLDALGIDGGGLLRGIAASVRSGDPSNCEGHAAREYWKRVFPADEEFKRSPGDGRGRNAQLDYAYMVLRGFAVKAVISAGLIPSLGMHHRNRGNYFCLADDMLEPYRPAIDRSVAELRAEDDLSDKSIKKYLVEAVNQQLNGTGLTIPSSLNDFAQQYGLYCEGRVDRLAVPEYAGIV